MLESDYSKAGVPILDLPFFFFGSEYIRSLAQLCSPLRSESVQRRHFGCCVTDTLVNAIKIVMMPSKDTICNISSSAHLCNRIQNKYLD